MKACLLFILTGLGGLAFLQPVRAQSEIQGNIDPRQGFPDDYRSPGLPPPEGQEIRRYAVDDPGPGATNFGVTPVHDNPLFYSFGADRLEFRSFDGGEAVLWDVQGWIGRHYHKFFVESEGEWMDTEEVESARHELLYGRAISSFFDLRAGLAYDSDPAPSRYFAVFGIQGLAPQWFEVDANLYVSEGGDPSFALEAEYDLLLTQRWILQPRLETQFAFRDDLDYGIAAGFTDVELGLRLRYEFSRKFAPYAGISWETALGETANRIEAAEEEADSLSAVVGLRFWF